MRQYPPIYSFLGKYFFLSNFYVPAPVKVNSVWYPSSEHAFMACKSLDPKIQEQIRKCSTPREARKLGRKILLRPDWEQIKYDIMYQAVKSKFFNNPNLGLRLIRTGDALLVEGNNWGDKTWGQVQNQEEEWEGKNWLGRILMDVRKELAEDIMSKKFITSGVKK